jgi:hypothetical protein
MPRKVFRPQLLCQLEAFNVRLPASKLSCYAVAEGQGVVEYS